MITNMTGLLNTYTNNIHVFLSVTFFHPVPFCTLIVFFLDTDEIPGFFPLLKNHIFIVRSEDTFFIFHV